MANDQAHVNLEHAERLSALEVHVSTIRGDMDRIVVEVIGIRRAVWFVGLAVLLNAGTNTQAVLKMLLSIL